MDLPEHWHDLAVEIVDGIRGFSVEFANDPQRQRDEYEIVKGILARHGRRGAVAEIERILRETLDAADSPDCPNPADTLVDGIEEVLGSAANVALAANDREAIALLRAARGEALTHELHGRIGAYLDRLDAHAGG